MSFHWEVTDNTTGEIVENDYPFPDSKQANISASRFTKRHGWDNASIVG